MDHRSTGSVNERLPRSLAPGEASRRIGLAFVGVALFVLFSLRFDNFFSADNILTVALNMSSIAIASIGTMALLASGNVDLSIGSQFALVSVVTATVARDTQNPVLAVVVALLVGALLGLFNGVLVRILRISPLIVTLGTLALYRGLAFVVAKGVPVYGFPESFTSIGGLRIARIPLPVIAAVVVFAAGGYVLLRSVPGLRLYALGGNAEAARMVGVRVNRMVIGVFTMNGLLMGLVALLATSRLTSGSPNLGMQFEMDVLTAVILGGVAFTGGAGHPLGVFIGVFTIGILNAGLIFAGLQDWYQQIAKGAVLLVALLSDQALQWWRKRGDRRVLDPDRELTAAVGSVHERLRRTPRSVGDVVLSVRDLSLSYGSVIALEGVGLQVRAGEVVCLVGDNGAGKSTLIKAISGVSRPDRGVIELDGRQVDFANPAEARSAGIETVYQDLALCQNLGVAHNLVLGEEPTRRLLGLLRLRDDRRAIIAARERLAAFGVHIEDFNRPVRMLSGGQRQSVAISRVLREDLRVIILDEPTAALGVTQTAHVLNLVRQVASEGHAVILISHDIEDILAVADRVVVLRLGQVTFDGAIGDVSMLDLVQLMAGMAPDERAAEAPPAGEPSEEPSGDIAIPMSR